MMLFPVSDDEPRLEPAALEALARLGITSVALLRDSSVAGLVLEGLGVRPARRATGGASRQRHPRTHPDAPAPRAHGHPACPFVAVRER